MDADLFPLKPYFKAPSNTIKGAPGIDKATLLNDKKTVVTSDKSGNVAVWDIIACKKITDYGKVDYQKAVEELNPDQWVANWCTIDTKSGDITVHIHEGKCLDAEIYFQDLESNSESKIKNEDQRSVLKLNS